MTLRAPCAHHQRISSRKSPIQPKEPIAVSAAWSPRRSGRDSAAHSFGAARPRTNDRRTPVPGIEQQSGRAAILPWAHLRLPPFPQVAMRVLQLANNENVQLHQLCDLISSDPAFASEVLTVANSLLYAPRYPSTSILQAVAVLGANTLQGMCVTVGVRAYLGKTMSYPAMRNLWRHNLACAIIAERLASGGFIDKDIAYTSGILHDIGRMALAVFQPKAYAELLEKHRGSAVSMLEAERQLFGWDHCETGRQLIGDWKLPDNFEAVVAEHHSAAPNGWRMGRGRIGQSELRPGRAPWATPHSPAARQRRTPICSMNCPRANAGYFMPTRKLSQTQSPTASTPSRRYESALLTLQHLRRNRTRPAARRFFRTRTRNATTPASACAATAPASAPWSRDTQTAPPGTAPPSSAQRTRTAWPCSSCSPQRETTAR